MSTCQIVRGHFGLSQEDLASLLGMSRAMLSLAELQRRTLSTQALMWLLPLARRAGDSSAAAPAPTPAAPTPGAADAVGTALAERQARCRHEAEQLRRELRPHHTRLLQAQRRLEVLPELRASLPTPLSPRHERWLAWFEQDARSTLQGPAAATAALLELRIAALEFEAREAGERAAALLIPVQT
jgi:transcriptional regulator with XRE-family HTH domain